MLAYDPALDSWCEVASMAFKRCGHGAVALGGKLYVIDGSFAEAEVYDPKADGWQPLPSMPTARSCLAAAAVAGKLYAIGGDDSDGLPSDAAEAYDPVSGVWTQVASLSVARSCHTATVVDGKIYVLGGNRVYPDDEDEGLNLDCVEVYDPAADNWQQMAAMPTARHRHAAVVLDGKIYVTGGFTSPHQAFGVADGEESNAVEAYDPVADTWTTLASLSKPRLYHASAVVDGKLYIFGGYSSDGETDLGEVYSPATNCWAPVADLPSAISYTVAIAL